MSEQWLFFPCSMGDDQAFIFLDEGIHEDIDNAPSLLARIQLSYKDPNPNGLPKKSEFEAVSNIEDQIQQFTGENKDWYVGRVTVAGHRYFYIYTNISEELWDKFIISLIKKTGYEIMVSFRNDPAHKLYWEELYPTDDDWQVINDLRVIEYMEKQGDDGTSDRKINHWAYFKDELSAKPFIEWAVQDRFLIEPEHSNYTDDGKYCVRLTHVGTAKIEDISSHTIALRRMASEFGGEYDGWETELIKNKG